MRLADLNCMLRLHTALIALSTIAALALGSEEANACSQGPPEEFPTCETLALHTPGKAFPQNLEERILLGPVARDMYGYLAETSVDLAAVSAPIAVEIETDGGYAPVEFTLETSNGASTSAQRIALATPRPGTYRVAWAGSTCGEPQVETGGGALIGSFTMTAPATYPEALGPLTSSSSLEQVTYDLGEASDCSPLSARAEVSTAEVHLDFSAAWMPWADSLSVAVYVDDELAQGFIDVSTEQAASGGFSATLKTICSSDNGEFLAALRPQPLPGTHRVRLAARLEGYETVYSDEIDFTVDCPGGRSGVLESDADQAGAGCAASGKGPLDFDFVALVAVLFGLGRRRRV